MPKINQHNTIDITVEKFLQACSRTEIQEVDLLLSSYLNDKPSAAKYQTTLEDFFKNLKEITTPEIYEEIKKLYIGINLNNFDAFILLIKMGYVPEAAFKAMEIIDSISTKSVLDPLEIVRLMPDFNGLENLRLISLSKRWKLINKPKDHDQS